MRTALVLLTAVSGVVLRQVKTNVPDVVYRRAVEHVLGMLVTGDTPETSLKSCA